MEFRDAYRFAAVLLLAIVADVLLKAAFDWPLNEDSNVVIAAMLTTIMAVRERLS